MNQYDLTCSDVEALVPAYVLSALEDEESCAFAHHLVECRLHDDDLAAERLMATHLGASTTPVAPPIALRNSLLDAFDKELSGTPVPIEAAKKRWSFGSLLRTPTFAYGIAAAVVVIALGLGVWGATRSNSDIGVSGVRQTSARSGDMKLDVTYLGSEHVAVISFDLPPAPNGRAYQAWQIADGKPVSLGLINGSGPLTVNADLKDASAIAISVEPPGGSQQPTTTPILVSQF